MNKNRNKVAAMMMVAAITVSSVAMPVEAAVSSVESVGIERGNGVDQEIQDVKLDAKNFPDVAFREILAEKFKIANDGTGVITKDMIEGCLTLYINSNYGSVESEKIKNLKGIEKFINLEELYSRYNNINSVDLSENHKLKTLYYENNNTYTLKIPKENLENLNCKGNNLKELDLKNCNKLLDLNVDGNSIVTLYLDDCKKLSSISAMNNGLEELDFSNNIMLTKINLRYCESLKRVTFGELEKLSSLDIFNTKISDLSLEKCKNLAQLDMSETEIEKEKLDLSQHKALQELNIQSSRIKEIVLPEDSILQILNAEYSDLEKINISNCKNLTTLNLYVHTDAFKYLDLSKCEFLSEFKFRNSYGYINFNKTAPLKDLTEIYNQNHEVKLSNNNSVDLNELFPGINMDKVDIKTEDIIKDGSILRFQSGNRPKVIEYNYNTGGKNNTLLLPVKLILDYESAEEGIILNDTNFPDYRFRRLIGNMMDVQEGGKISNTKLANIANIEVYNEGITTLKGIEFFTGLKSLECGKNNLTELDLSENINLKEIYCEDNSISDLKLPKSNNLMYLDCSNNKLDNLNLAKYDKLIDLNCSSNPINKLELTNNTLLERIDIRKTNINSLNLKNQNVLENLYIEGSAISNKNNIELNPNTNVNIDVDLSNSGEGTTTPDQKPDQKPDEKPNKPNKPGNITSKIVGKNRYETAAKIADELVKNNVSYNSVILVNSDKSMADGLSAASLSGKKNAPILLVKRDSIPAEAMAKIEKAKNVYIIGGEGAISKKVENQLKGKNITRISGKDRYETSAKIANMLGGYKMAFIVNGAKGEADAMSVSSVAAKYGAPILLTNGKTSTHPVKAGVSYFVIGGRGVVSNQLADKYNADRIAGIDRYSTNRKVIDEFYYDSKKVYFAKGDTLVDALTASLLAKDNGMVLVSKNANHKKLEGKEAVQVGGMDFEISFE